MAQGKILTVQDISCFGKCSMTVALPILSACGHETSVLPTAVLSTHTGGFGPVHKRDLTDDFPEILAHWKRLEMCFETVYVGYLGSPAQVEFVKEIFQSMVADSGVRVLDPVMADNGKLYSGITPEYVRAMKTLCTAADVIIPNITEACLLTDTPYPSEVTKEFVQQLAEKLEKLCPRFVLTGVGYCPEETGVVLGQNGRVWHYAQKKISGQYHGTGDIFAASFIGAWRKGKTMEEAAQIAAEYTASCIKFTGENSNISGEIQFESSLPKLINELL